MASTSNVNDELVSALENTTISSEPDSPDRRSEPDSPDTVRTDETDEVEEPLRPFNAPRKCYGLKWVNNKGLTLCPRDAQAGRFKYAFCGKTHQDAFYVQDLTVPPSFYNLFYHFVFITTDIRPDLAERFSKHVVPFFLLKSAQNQKYAGRPIYLTFTSLEDAVEFDTDIKHNTVRYLRQFYEDIKPNLRRHLRDIVAVMNTTPDEAIASFDTYFERLTEPDFSRIPFRYYIDLA